MGHLVFVDLLRHRARTALTALGIAIGVATIVALLGLSAGIERSAAGLVNLGGAELGMFQGGVGELHGLLAAAVTRRPRAARARRGGATPIAVATGELSEEPSFLVFGVEPGSFVYRALVLVEGRSPRAADEAIVGDAAARQHGLRVGGRLELAEGGFEIVGIYHAGVPFEDQGAALPLATVSRMRDRPEDATTIAVKVSRGVRASELGDRLGRAFPGTVAISQPGQVSRVDTNSLLVRKAALVFGAVAGIALGTAAGGLIVRALGVSALVSPRFTPATLAIAVAVAAVTGTIGSLYPAWWVTRLRVSESLG